MVLQCAGQGAAVEVFRNQREVGCLDAELHGQIQGGRRFTATGNAHQNHIGSTQIAISDAVIMCQGVVDRLDPVLVIRTIGASVGAADGVRGLDIDFGLNRGQKRLEEIQTEGRGLLQ